MKPEEHHASDAVGDSRRASVYDPTPLLIGRRLSERMCGQPSPCPVTNCFSSTCPSRAEHGADGRPPGTTTPASQRRIAARTSC